MNNVAKPSFLNILNRKRLWWLVFPVVLGLILYLYLEKNTILSFHWNINPLSLLASVVFHILSFLLNFIGWHIIMSVSSKGIDIVSNLHGYSLTTIARRLPSPIWHMGTRFAYYLQMGVPATNILFASSIELVMMCITGLETTIFFAFTYIYRINFPITLLGIALINTAILLRPNWFVRFINFFLRLIKKTPIEPNLQSNSAFILFLVYTISWLSESLAIYYCFVSFYSIMPTIIQGLTLSIIISISGYLAQFLPSGFGIKELLGGVLFSDWLPTSVGLILGIAYRIESTLIDTIALLIINIKTKNNTF